VRTIILSLLVAVLSAHAQGPDAVDADSVSKSARDIPSIYLTSAQKENVARTFLELVILRSPSGQEGAIRTELRNRLKRLGAVEIAQEPETSNAPLNLVMVLAASKEDSGKQALLLNAHVDTIGAATPERLRFDSAAGDLFHADEGVPGKRSSYGADDKAGVAVIIGCLSALRESFWSTNAAHRRIVVALTAREEQGKLGARYLAEHQPEVFDNLQLALTFDGPIDFHSDYPAVSFMVVVSDQDVQKQPYQRVLDLVAEVAKKKGARFGRTELGLGMGDFAEFPASAHSGLHIRSPQRGFHTQERTKLADLINHVDLLCHVLLTWDRNGASQ
jgi:putative aminopeptidase FrvX